LVTFGLWFYIKSNSSLMSLISFESGRLCKSSKI
jgi:hypothetical protein